MWLEAFRKVRSRFTGALGKLLGNFGIEVVSMATQIESRAELAQHRRDIDFFVALSSRYDVSLGLRHLADSRAQLRQDLFVLTVLGGLREGYFVEFGATDGIQLSNTWMLEKEFGWGGIVVEPAKGWHAALQENRGCSIDFRCVWSVSHESLAFREVISGELSTLERYVGSDAHSSSRARGKNYRVDTVSLLDLLRENDAPQMIDYLSIDTEGSEFEILNAFNFEEFSFSVISIEHNFRPEREQIRELLATNGYERVFEELSLFDDWYLLQK